MKVRTILLTFLIAAVSNFLFAQEKELFISEYCEFDHNVPATKVYNHYIELYNPTGETVDLTNYQLWRAKNGGGWNLDGDIAVDPLSLTGSLAAGSVYIIARPADDPSEITADITWSFLNISGDDAIALAKDKGSGTFEVIDLIGNPDNDPGAAWDAAGITEATINRTLVRKSTICSPSTDWAASAGTTTENSQWEVKETNDISNLGTHTSDCETTGINDFNEITDKIYPMPNAGNFSFISNTRQQIKVINVTGKVMTYFDVKAGKNKVNLELKPGVYMLIPEKSKSLRLVIR